MKRRLRDHLDGRAPADCDEHAARCWNDHSVESRCMDVLDCRLGSLVRQEEHSYRFMVCLDHEVRRERAVKLAGACIRDSQKSGLQSQPLLLQKACQCSFGHDIQRVNQRCRFVLSMRDQFIGEAGLSARQPNTDAERNAE
jgi:hypothetical protein